LKPIKRKIQSILFFHQKNNIPFIGDSNNQNTSAAFVYWKELQGATKLKS